MGRRLPGPAGYHWDQKEPVVDSMGRRTCRWCKGVVRPPRSTFCGEECVFNWTRRTRWKLTREWIFQKRRGRCEKCGLDLRLNDPAYCLQQLDYAMRIEDGASEKGWRKWKPPVHLVDGMPGTSDWWKRQHHIALDLSRENKCLGRSIWDVDHIIPLALGGDAYEELNLAVLCIRCHRLKTLSDGSRFVNKENR
jgi:hypothetical protein